MNLPHHWANDPATRREKALEDLMEMQLPSRAMPQPAAELEKRTWRFTVESKTPGLEYGTVNAQDTKADRFSRLCQKE
jgi:hypothetical protein